MDIEKIKEDLSMCYLNTIAAVNGIAFERIQHDEDSMDVMLKKDISINETLQFHSQISVQLKSTSSETQYSIGKNDIIYKLKVKNYNDLCRPSAMPSMLALLILPNDEKEWVKWTVDELMIKGKMYWLSLQGYALSENVGTVSVKIPKANVLNNESIEILLKKVAKEGQL